MMFVHRLIELEVHFSVKDFVIGFPNLVLILINNLKTDCLVFIEYFFKNFNCYHYIIHYNLIEYF